VSESWAIETDNAKCLRGRGDDSTKREVLQQRAVAMQHNQNRAVGRTSLEVMQFDAFNLDELSERRMASAGDELESDVAKHDRHDRCNQNQEHCLAGRH
jgi:hypothetical protein